VKVNGAEPSTAELVAAIAEDARELVRLEMALAQQEAREFVSGRTVLAIGLFAFAGLLLGLALLVALPVFVITAVPNHVAAALIWLGGYVLLALICAGVGYLLLRRLEIPPRTLTSLKETREWVLRLISSNGR
jgi:nitrate reductase gamma subunit